MKEFFMLKINIVSSIFFFFLIYIHIVELNLLFYKVLTTLRRGRTF